MISNLINKKGYAVKNQFIITENDNIIFQSYTTNICKVNKNKKIITISNYWNGEQSQTTSRHFYSFIYQILGITVLKNDIDKAITEKKLLEYTVIKADF